MTDITETVDATAAASSLVFDMISRAEQFGDKKIDIVVCDNEPWFRGKDIAEILEYTNNRKALTDHVKPKNKTTLNKLCAKSRRNEMIPLTFNQKTTIYINEAGLYQLIMHSKQAVAEQFQDWVTDDLLPKVRKLGQDKYNETISLQLQDAQRQLAEHKEDYERLHRLNEELVTYKKLKERNETIYIVSTHLYAKQGLYKVGRTKNIKMRNSAHNTSHPAGDKVRVLATFKVNSAVLVENAVHKKLEGLRPERDSEFFLAPYNLLFDIVDLIINYDHLENEAVNRIIDAVYHMRIRHFSHLDWMSGLDPEVFRDEMRLVTPTDADETKTEARFDMTNATEEQKQEFVRECIDAYRRTVQVPAEAQRNVFNIVWKAFQGYMLQRLEVPRNRFKALEWKPLVQTEVERDPELAIQWRGGNAQLPAPSTRLALPAPEPTDTINTADTIEFTNPINATEPTAASNH